MTSSTPWLSMAHSHMHRPSPILIQSNKPNTLDACTVRSDVAPKQVKERICSKFMASLQKNDNGSLARHVKPALVNTTAMTSSSNIYVHPGPAGWFWIPDHHTEHWRQEWDPKSMLNYENDMMVFFLFNVHKDRNCSCRCFDSLRNTMCPCSKTWSWPSMRLTPPTLMASSPFCRMSSRVTMWDGRWRKQPWSTPLRPSLRRQQWTCSSPDNRSMLSCDNWARLFPGNSSRMRTMRLRMVHTCTHWIYMKVGVKNFLPEMLSGQEMSRAAPDLISKNAWSSTPTQGGGDRETCNGS